MQESTYPQQNSTYSLVEKKKETSNVMTLRFRPVTQGKFTFVPGQYVDVMLLKGEFAGYGRSYSLSGKASDPCLSITVKNIGRVSGALHEMAVGEQVIMTGPSGFFYPSEDMQRLVFFAGGIGIAPFYDILINFEERNLTGKSITLLYSNRTVNDITFYRELINIQEQHPNVKIIHNLTREAAEIHSIDESGRITLSYIQKYVSNAESQDTGFFICGSIEFVDAMWKLLDTLGIKEKNIFIEPFY